MIVDTSTHSGGLFVEGELARVRSRGKQHFNVDSVLKSVEEEDEIEEGGSAADQRSLDQTTLDGVEIYDSQGLYSSSSSSTLAADRSIFCLSLLKNDTGATYKNLSERMGWSTWVATDLIRR